MRKKMNPLSIILGGGGARLHGNACWLIAYSTMHIPIQHAAVQHVVVALLLETKCVTRSRLSYTRIMFSWQGRPEPTLTSSHKTLQCIVMQRI